MMKKSIFKRVTALLLVLIIGLFSTACSMFTNEISDEPTVSFSLITDEAEAENKSDDESETNESQAPPTETTTEKTTTTSRTTKTTATTEKSAPKAKINENGKYDTKDEVALYIHTFGHLPSNYITKKQAEKLGWSGGSLKNYAPGCCIGGDRFGNYEGLLPKASGRTYTECDIGTMNAKSRGAKRIIFSNDGLIFYTDNHYESFTQLY